MIAIQTVELVCFKDSTFTWSDFMTKNNSELLNNLGNFVNRALAFCEKNMDARVPALHLGNDELKLIARINQEIADYERNLERLHLRDGISNILSVSRVGNQYMQAKKPWVLVKGTDEERTQGATAIALCLNISYLLSILVYPYMPKVSITIRQQLNLPVFDVVKEKESYDSSNIKSESYSYPKFYSKFVQFLKEGHQIGKAEPLFKRITDADIKEWKQKFGGQQNQAAAPEVPQKSKRQLEKEKKEARKLQQAQTESTPAAAPVATSDVKVESN